MATIRSTFIGFVSVSREEPIWFLGNSLKPNTTVPYLIGFGRRVNNKVFKFRPDLIAGGLLKPCSLADYPGLDRQV